MADPTFEQAALAAKPDPELGAYLAAECLACHRASAPAAGIPIIARRPRDVFILALAGYRSGERRHPVMEMVARSLEPEEAGALAAYFEAQTD